MSDQFVAEIRPFAFNFAHPLAGRLCNRARILAAITQNAALFSLLGTNYGGNGTVQLWACPTSKGSTSPSTGVKGTWPGQIIRSIGETAGTTTVTINQSQMPAHSHPAEIPRAVNADTTSPSGAALGHGRR